MFIADGVFVNDIARPSNKNEKTNKFMQTNINIIHLPGVTKLTITIIE